MQVNILKLTDHEIFNATTDAFNINSADQLGQLQLVSDRGILSNLTKNKRNTETGSCRRL